MYLLESPYRGDSNKYTKDMHYKRKCSKLSVTDVLDGSCQVRFYSKIFGNKHCHYSEGPLFVHYTFNQVA